MNDLDRAFAQFARTGDPTALGQVYDQSAPELLALATRLCGDPVDAEDLVQATFVAAIESAARFAAGKRVMPWLVGILNNRVRRWRRARQPRAPTPSGSAPLQPAELLQQEELQAQVTQALERLSPVLHPVLVLHLRHGMAPAEIAYALGRPSATVRSQLARGLEQLRQRLPQHLPLPALLLLPLPRGLGAVRDVVLAAARAHSAATAATAFWSAMLMAKQTKVLVAVFAVMLGSALAWWQPWNGEPAARAVVAAARLPQALPSAAPDADRHTGAPDTGEPERREASATALRVSVRDDGKPIAGACIALQPAGGAVRHGVTDVGGEVLFDALPGGDGSCTLLGCVQSYGGYLSSDYHIAVGSTGTLSLEALPPAWVHGLVLLPSGAAAADAQVWIGLGPLATDGVIDVMRTRADGTFDLALWMQALVGARAPGTVPTHREVDVASGSNVDLVLHLGSGGAALRGQVVDADDGHPIGGAAVEIGDRFGWYVGRLRSDGSRETVLPLPAISDADGRFAVDGVLAGMVTVHAQAPGHATAAQLVTLPIDGTAAVTIRLTRGGSVRGTVTREDGRPAADATVQAGDAAQFGTVMVRADNSGHYELAHVPAGVVALRADTPGWGRATAHLQLDAGKTIEWNVVLDSRWQAITGKLIDDHGQALRGWWVVAHTDSPHDQGSPARVAADGSFALGPFPDYPAVYELRVHPECDAGNDGRPAAEAVLVQRGVRVGARDVTLAVPAAALPTAWIRGRLAERSGLTPVLVGEAGTGRALPVDADGSFHFGPLAPGRWRIVLPTFPQAFELTAFELQPRQQFDVGTVAVPNTLYGAVDLELATTALHPDFAPEFEGTAALQVLTADLGFVRWANLHADANRRCRIDLLPGRYLLRLCGAPLAPSPQTCEVRAGETTRVQFDMRPAALRRIAFRHPGTAQPFEPLALEVHDRSGAVVWSSTVQPRNSWWQWELNLEPGRYRVRAHTASGLTADGELVIETADPGLRPQVFELQPPQ